MKDTGIIREIDGLGRIVIPKEIRDNFQMVKVEIFVKGENIVISKFNNDNLEKLSIVREIDQIGRLVIPREVRNKLEIEENNPLEIWSNGNTIILKKHKKSCIFCKGTKDLIVYKDKFICNKCKEILKTI